MPRKNREPLSDRELENLLNFVGYGNLRAPIWFIGIEERGSQESLRYRSTFAKVEDLKNAHIRSGKNKEWEEVELQPTWKRMCWIILALQGQEMDNILALDYQSKELGRKNGETMLMELLPIAKKKLNSWGLEGVVRQFESLSEYKKKVKPIRIKLLRGLLAEYRPRVVVCYGRWWTRHKDIFDNLVFHKKGNFLVSVKEGRIVILSDHMTMIGRDKSREIANIILKNSSVRL